MLLVGAMDMRPHHRLAFAALRPLIARRHEDRTLLVLGVMRSGSTLLTHILADNPGIAGFGEAHLVYDRPERLDELAYWTLRFSHRWPEHGSYLMDKVLHAGYLPDLAEVARATRLHVLLLLREPEGNAASLERMFASEGRKDRAGTVRYLEKRLRELSASLDALPGDVPFAALSYDALRADPEGELARLTGFLQLRQPLAPRYGMTPTTGRWGFGDGSAKIRAGTIVKPESAPRPQISADLAGAHALYAALEAGAARRDPTFTPRTRA